MKSKRSSSASRRPNTADPFSTQPSLVHSSYMRSWLIWISVTMMFVYQTVGAECQGTVMTTALGAPSGFPFESFGATISMDPPFMVVGAFAPGPETPREGRAYILRNTGGTWEFESLLSIGENGEGYFGNAVGISRNVVIVGGINTGMVRVYRRTELGSWNLEANLLPAAGSASGANFGRSIAIHGTTVVVGMPRDGASGAETGSVYVYRYNGQWSREAILKGNDTKAGDEFGHSVAVWDNTIAIGSILSDPNGNASGSAYVFTRTGNVWTQKAKLLGHDTMAGDTFGNHVALRASVMVVGASGKGPGAAYVFRFNGASWIEEMKLAATDGVAGDSFGTQVALDENAIVVGSRAACNGVAIGAGYVFSSDGTSWQQSLKLIPPDVSESDQFGGSVAIGSGLITIGTPRADVGVVNAGAVYLYQAYGVECAGCVGPPGPQGVAGGRGATGATGMRGPMGPAGVSGTNLVSSGGILLFKRGTAAPIGFVKEGITVLSVTNQNGSRIDLPIDVYRK